MPIHQLALVATELAQDLDVEELGDAVEADGLTATDWAVAGAVLGGAVVLAIVARRAIGAGVRRLGGGGFAAALLGRLVAYLVVAIGLVYALSRIGVRIGPLLGALGIIGIALAFALRDILENFAAGIILQIRRPFDMGDEIVTGDHEGRVLQVTARTVEIRSPDGELVVLPSSSLISDTIVNLTDQDVRRTTVDVGVAYETDLRTATEVLRRVVAEAPGVVKHPPVEARVHTFGESTIDIAVRFWHHPTIAAMWATRDAVAIAIKEGLDEAGITIAFPQRVLWWGAAADGEDDDRPS